MNEESVTFCQFLSKLGFGYYQFGYTPFTRVKRGCLLSQANKSVKEYFGINYLELKRILYSIVPDTIDCLVVHIGK